MDNSRLHLEDFLKNLPANYPVCVDLDRTLTYKDISCMAWCSLGFLEKLRFLLYFFKGSAGKAKLKERLYYKSSLDLRKVLLRKGLIRSLGAIHHKHPIFLVTGVYCRIAEKVSRFINIFKEVHGTAGEKNFVAEEKKGYLGQRFGHHFVYIGDSFQDMVVWEQSSHVVAVDPGFFLKKALLRKFLHKKPLLIVGSL